MIVAAHQPHFLPWLGYLDKLAKADVFVVMDDLQYEPQNFQNRNRVKTNHGPTWLSVPLLAAKQSATLLERRIDNTGRGGRHHWQHRMWRTLEVHYGRAPYFTTYAPALRELCARRWDSLVELDLQVLDLARGWFGITKPIVRASSLGLRGAKTARIQDLCTKLGAKIYLSGKGGSQRYLDVDQLARGGVTTLWQTFQHPQYPQRYAGAGFVSHLACFDLLLNMGPAAAAVMWPAAPAQLAEGSHR